MNKKQKHNRQQSQKHDLIPKEIPLKYFYYFIIAFTFLIYARSIGNEYAIDDAYVTSNARISQEKSSFAEIWTSNYATVIESGEELNFGYRPMVKLSFALDHAVFGKNPHASHLINLLLYISLLLLLFHILKKLFKDYSIWIPFMIVLIYSAHPINTEVVCSLKNRDVLLSFLFSLISLLMFMQFSDDKKWWKLLLGFILFALALFSKVTALTFIVVIPLVLYFYKDMKIYMLVMLFFTLLILYVSIRLLPRLTYLEPTFRPKFFFENPLFFNREFLVRLSTGLFILLYYLKLLFFPHPLLFYYGYNMVDIASWSNPLVWISLLFYLSIFIYAIINIRKKTIESFALLYFLVTISMFANFIRPPSGIVADRFMFRPVLGFSIILVILILRLYKENFKVVPGSFNLLKSKAIIPFVIILSLYSFKTISRTDDWKDTMTLLERDMKYLKNSAKANYIYAGTLRNEAYEKIQKSGNIQQAMPLIYQSIDYGNQAVNVYSGYYDAYNMLGETYFMYLKENDKAISYFNKAIEVNPEFGLAYYNLGFIARNNKQYDTAVWYLKQAIKFNPSARQFYFFLSDLYREMGNDAEAQRYISLGKDANKFKKVRKNGKRRVKKTVSQDD